MEKKEILKWREHLIKMFGVCHSDEMRHTDCPLCGVNLEKISDFMIEELDKAREEGFEQGYKEAKFDCEMGKEFSKESFKEVVSSVLSKLKDNK